MVDFGLGGVALGRWGEGERARGVAGDGKVEDVLADGSASAERSEDDGRLGGVGGSQELEGEILLRL